MVLPSPTAAEGEAPAEWLKELRRWLHLGRKGVIIMIRDAQPARLREVVEILEGIEPGFLFTTRAEDIAECSPGKLVLLAPREEDLDWLNLNRPQFAQRELRAVLWVEPTLSAVFRFRAPDLHDWVSHFVRCPPGVPRFAVEGLRVGLRWWPGVAWRGEGLEIALSREGHQDVTTLNPSDDFEAVVAVLSTAGRKLVRWRGVNTARNLWRLRWATAWARYYGPSVLDNPSIETPGWFQVDAHQTSIWKAASQIQRHGVLDPYKVAAQLELEAGLLDHKANPLSQLTVAEPDEVVTLEVALLVAPPHLQRTFHEHPKVIQARSSVVRKVRTASSEDGWSRSELGVFASLERDRRSWPDHTNATRWTLEHSLRMGVDEDRRQPLMDIFFIIEEHDIVRCLANEWGQRPSPSPGRIARDTWLRQAATTASISADEIETTKLRDQTKSLIKLGNAIGWDVESVTRTLAQILRLIIASGDLDTLRDVIERVLDAASKQLGVADTGYATLGRIAGIALGAAGLFDLACEPLDHAWTVLRASHDELAVELAMVLAQLGRFSRALEILASTNKWGKEATRLRRFILRAMGEQEAEESADVDPIDARAEAQNYLEARLFAFVRPAPA